MKHSKYIVSPLRFFLLLAVPFLFTAQPVWSAAVTTPANLPTYYNSYIDGKSGTDLFTGIHNVAKVGYSSLSYSGLWTAYNTTDVYPTGHDKAGKIWDLYSYCTSYTPGTDQDKGSGSAEGTVYNREHSIPKSWFGGSTNNNTPGTDIFHVYPTDKIVNGKRSNYAFGEVTVGNATYSSNKGCGGFSSTDLEGYSRLGSGSAITISNTIVSKTGSTTQSPTSSPVFEPLSEYKGDLARSYFGTMIRWANDYAAFTTGDGSCMFSGTYTEAGHWGLTPYGVALLMKWHREDPVSQKEIDRNNGIQSTQGNRNPFIDYPCLAEYLWGEHAGETFSLSTAVGSFENGFTPGVSDGCACAGPTITSPTGTINIGTTNTSTSIVKDITIQGVNLASGSLTLSITGTNSAYFSLSTTSISNANAEAGYNVTVTYNPTANGSHTATLNISGCGLTSPHTVTLTGTCTIVYTATWMADGSTFGTSTAASGASPELPAPNPSNCTSSRVFVGWTATSGYTGNSAPADLFTTTAPTITTDKTFYAVYADATTSGSGSSDEFNLFSGSLEEGDYIIYYNGKAMKASVSSNRLAYAEKTPVNDVITNDDATIIWHIAQSGGYWTIYNANTGKYAAANGTKNQAALNDSGTDDKSLWTASGSSTYEFVNKSNSANSVNANLRENGTYGFACYSTGTGGALSLYKASATTTYENYSTTCSTGPTVTVTFHANGGTGTMPAQTVPQSTNTTLSTNTFTRDGYSFAGWATTSSGAKVYDDGGTINTSTDIDLYAKWTALPTYTVTWKVNNTTYVTGTPTTSVISGNKVTVLPSTPSVPSSCTGKTFVGWSATNIGSTPVSSAPADLFTSASGSPNITSTITFYAVFAEEEASTTTYERVTSLAQLDDADSIVIVNAYASSNFALPTTLATAAAAPTETDGKITNINSSYKWKLTKSGSDWTFCSGSSYLGAASMPTSDSRSADVSLTSSNTTWSITANTYTGNGENCFTIVNSASSSAGLEYSSGWKLYYATNLNTSWYTLKLYVPVKIETYVTACACTYTITATTDDDSMGTVSVTTP